MTKGAPSPRFGLSLLGGFELTGPDGVVDLPSKKIAGLLAYLACTVPKAQPRERLSALLWGSYFEAQAKQNLRQALYRLRSVLGQDALESDGDVVSLNAAAVQCDASRFEALVREGSRDALSAAVDLYRGHLMDDVAISEKGWNEWLSGEREKLLELALGALMRLGEQELAAGRAEHALKAGQRAITLNNLREDAHRLIVQALAAAGRKAEALKHYQDLVALLKRELNTEPDAATKSLVAELRSTQPPRGGPTGKEVATPAMSDRRRTEVQPAGDMSEDPEQTVKAKSIEARSDSPSPAVAARSASPERRQLTIMVCTMVVSRPLTGDLDPEEMSERIAPFHKVVADVAARFGGFVAQYLGDGVHVYFGYPAAHEHDAEQAVRAGLALLDAVGMLEASSGVTFRARAGIATGLVVVGEQLGTSNAQQHIAIGDAPNLAARLEAMAAPGEVVIAASTRRLVGGMFDCHALGTDELKGLPPSVEAWRVRGQTVGVSRFEARRAGALSPLVGRQEEMELLLRRWHQAKAGEGRVVLLSGEPGIGKSRIAETVLTRLEGEPHAGVRYFCSPHHTHSPLYPFIAQLERAASFEAGSSAREKLDKLQALLKPTARNVPQDLALIAELLAVPLDERYPVVEVSPQQKREMALSALLHQLEGLAVQGPVLIVFEDAQWIDPTSLDLLDRTVAHIAKLPVLMVVTFRPEFQPTWVGQPHVTMLPLSRLGRGDSASMLCRLTKGKALPDAVAQHVLAHTDGVPLFIEELTSMLLESEFLRETGDCYALDGPLPPLAIPTTLQASLMARLDRLSSVKDVAQIGAAIGREFSYELIAPVSELPPGELEAALEQLAAAGLISRRGAPPVATYSFKHALVQDAAYASLVRSRRHRLHATVARVLEERFPALAQAQPELVAHHYTSAGLYRQSISYWLKAGQLANDRSANSEAVSHLSRGLELLATLPSSCERDNRELDLLLALGRALIIGKGYADPEVERVYSRAQALSTEVSDPSQRFVVVRGLWTFRLAKGEVETARHLATELLHLTEEQQLAHLRSAANLSLGQTAVHLGSFVDAHGYFERAIEQTKAIAPRRRPTQDALVTCYCYDAQALWHLGRLQATVRRIEDAIARAKNLTTPYNSAFAFFHAACIHRYLGDKAGARRWALQSIALSEEHSFPYLRAFAMALRGWSGGVTEAEEALAAFRQIGAGLWAVEVLAILAEVYADAERSTEALEHLEASLAEGRRTGERWREAEVHRLLGELLLRMSPAAHHEAEESFSQALQVAREQHAKSLELRAALSLSRLWCRLDKRADAHHLLAGVYGYFTEDFDTADLRDAKALLGELSHT
jgi:class 3 adenylate cyclase/predicted ATPase/chloramphenicol 3-O-phosphotransferase